MTRVIALKRSLRYVVDVGIAVRSEYGVFGTGVSSVNLENIEYHFQYDWSAEYVDRDVDRMIEEICWLRPIYFHGNDPIARSGHNWVVFGYDRSVYPIQFKMNVLDRVTIGWYTLDGVIYPSSQMMLVPIAPRYVARFVGSAGSGNGAPDSPFRDIEEAVANSPNHATLIFKAGSVNTFSAESITISKPLTLKGIDVVIRKE